MFSALTITSTKQGLDFDAATSANVFAIVEKIEGLVAFATRAILTVKSGLASLSRRVLSAPLVQV